MCHPDNPVSPENRLHRLSLSASSGCPCACAMQRPRRHCTISRSMARHYRRAFFARARSLRHIGEKKRRSGCGTARVFEIRPRHRARGVCTQHRRAVPPFPTPARPPTLYARFHEKAARRRRDDARRRRAILLVMHRRPHVRAGDTARFRRAQLLV